MPPAAGGGSCFVEWLPSRDPDEVRYNMHPHIVRVADRLGILLSDDVV
jgi:hypothetical protein